MTIDEIIGTICIITGFIGLLILGLLSMYWTIKTENIRQEYIKTLNEHDKAVILDYQNSKYTIKRRKRNNMKDSE